MPKITRSQIRILLAEFPQGDPHGGPPAGKREDPVTLGTVATYASIATAGVSILNATGVIGGGKGGGDGTVLAPPPTVTPPPTMPLPNDQAVQDAKRRSVAAQVQRQGRQSTILTGPASSASDLLGG
jgi:hypothetical protein